MLKTLRDVLFGALVAGAVGAAMATVGTPPPPNTGPALVDGVWLNGVIGGLNYSYQSGISAAGSAQTNATQLPSNIYLLETDTVAGSTGVNLPPALQGTALLLYNNGGSTLTVYPAVANNPVTAAQDTINNGTSVSVSSHAGALFFAA